MKGSIQDLGTLIFIVTIFVTSSIFGAVLYFNLKSTIQPIDTANVTGKIFQSGDTIFSTWINSLGFIIICIGIGAVILSFFIPTHPIFLPVSIIMYVMYIILAVGFSNLLWEFLNTPGIVTTANQYPLMVYIVQYLPHIIAFIGFMIMLVMYSKRGIGE
jgi:hypothetical protein